MIKYQSMTKEEMLKKISKLSLEQKDFLNKEVKKHSPPKKENARSVNENNQEKPKK